LFSTTLGDDPRYRPGRTSARFTFADYDFFDRLTTYLTVTIAWTASQMTITINGSTPEFLSPVVAGDFVGSETGSVETSVPVTITIDSDEMFVAEGEAVIRGQVATSTVVRGWDEFEISTVDVSGKATLCQ
jgi:hypothetical protein